MSIAMGIDYGVFSRINFLLKQPSGPVVILMSAARLYHMMTKVTSTDGKAGLERIPRVTILHRLKKPFPTARGSLSLLVENQTLIV